MVLNSPVFVFLFLPLILAIYFAVPARATNISLLVASLLFYAWGDSSSLPILLISIPVNYAFGILIGGVSREPRKASETRRKIYLAFAIGANLSLLFFYKYLKFSVVNLGALHILDASRFNFEEWHLPLGISFFTFGAVAYLMDIYGKKSAAETNLIDFGLYVSFFAKVLAGPIVRYSDVAGELEERKVTVEGFARGVRRFMLGLGKKVLVANPVSILADEIFRAPGNLDMPTAWLGLVCYTIQIYFDFSGYSDMAIGLGSMFGFTFMENFNYPYISRSIQEFWRRWHISLSTWFRDYLYIPLGGNRKSEARTYANLVLVFLLCGFWHGAGWGFIVWGLYHGLLLVLERLGLAKALQKMWRPLRHLYAVLAIMIGWVFFRAEDLAQAVQYLRAMFSFRFDGFDYYVMTFINRQMLLTLAVGVIGSAPVAALAKNIRDRLAGTGDTKLLSFYDFNCSLAGVALVVMIFIASAMQMAITTFSPFIYAKF